MYLNMPFAYFTSPQDWLIVGLIAAINIIPIWALIDCAIRPMENGSKKALWIIAILFTGIFGTIAYCIFGRKPAPEPTYHDYSENSGSNQ